MSYVDDELAEHRAAVANGAHECAPDCPTEPTAIRLTPEVTIRRPEYWVCSCGWHTGQTINEHMQWHAAAGFAGSAREDAANG